MATDDVIRRPGPDFIDTKLYKEGRFYVLGVIAWIAFLVLADTIPPIIRHDRGLVIRSALSLIVVSVILYYLYRGKRLARILVAITMLGTSVFDLYKAYKGLPDPSIYSLIHTVLMLIGSVLLWSWRPVQVFLEAQRTGMKPQFQTDEIPEDYAWLFPPKEVHSAVAWDKYWREQIQHGLGPAFCDMFCRDDELVRAAQNYGVTTVLCIGNGISQEPIALSKAGFHVTAMDISPIATEICRELSKGFSSSEHFFDSSLLRPNGTVKFVVGDIFNNEDCPEPYDIVIERRTIQDYPQSRHAEAIACVLARLATTGIILSHCHDNRWNPIKNPGAAPSHATRSLIAGQGVAICSGELPEKLDRRIAVTITTTG